jgi:DeoR/GlpR family transcriptional regulator of sugar metabolism
MKSESSVAFDVELLRIVSVAEAARMRGVSTDTIRREFKTKMVRVSKGRVGLRLRDVVTLPTEEQPK